MEERDKIYVSVNGRISKGQIEWFKAEMKRKDARNLF
jgi:hypothetical protein